jgi:hypothetical protein
MSTATLTRSVGTTSVDASTRPIDSHRGSASSIEFTATPKDDGQDFSGQSLRIFAIGHVLEDLAVAWLRGAGFDLYTRKGNRPDGGQFGFSVAGGRIRGHVDGIIAAGHVGFDLAGPALWECKTMNAKNWRACVKDGVTKSKPVYAAQIAVYQAYIVDLHPEVTRVFHRELTRLKVMFCGLCLGQDMGGLPFRFCYC